MHKRFIFIDIKLNRLWRSCLVRVLLYYWILGIIISQASGGYDMTKAINIIGPRWLICWSFVGSPQSFPNGLRRDKRYPNLTLLFSNCKWTFVIISGLLGRPNCNRKCRKQLISREASLWWFDTMDPGTTGKINVTITVNATIEISVCIYKCIEYVSEPKFWLHTFVNLLEYYIVQYGF